MQRNRKRMKLVGMLTVIAICLVMGICNKNDGVTKLMAAGNIPTPKLTIVSRTTSSVNLSFTKSSGATGYQVYRADSKNGTYKKVDTISSLSYKDADVKDKNTYYYKVRAYKTTNGKNTYSKFSEIKTARSSLGKVTNVKVAKATENISISWSKVNSATQYRVYRATSKTGNYSYLGSSSTNSYKDQTAKEGITYYYKVRAYAVIGGTKYYGNYSSVVSGKISKNQTGGTSGQESDFAKEVLRLVNVERAKEGLSQLSTTQALTDAANKRAIETEQYFSHTRPDGTSCFTVLKEFNVSYRACGENIAYGQRTPEEVMNGWMNSQGHRKNIMSSNFGKMGVGMYVKNGTIYWVQLFTN